MAETSTSPQHEDESRRDFLVLAATAVGAVGAAAFAWPLVHSMNPSAEVLALASTDVDLSGIQPGQAIKVMWRGKPVFVRHRTSQEIEQARAVDVGALPDPQADDERVQEPEWLIVLANCTHLGCVPLGASATEPRGDFGGWFCPCHGSHFDTAGRIRRGPAPINLIVPPYEFVSDSVVRIG